MNIHVHAMTIYSKHSNLVG